MIVHTTPGGQKIGNLAINEPFSAADADRVTKALRKAPDGRWYLIYPTPDPKQPRDPETADIANSRPRTDRDRKDNYDERGNARTARRQRIGDRQQPPPGYRWVATGSGRRLAVKVTKAGG